MGGPSFNWWYYTTTFGSSASAGLPLDLGVVVLELILELFLLDPHLCKIGLLPFQ
jgi:hypothetical protein